MSRPLLLGHRGARSIHSIPENTIPSFDRALADGCDGFEFDVRLTADGEAVVCHDPRVGPVEIALTSAKNLPNLPRLDDVLSRYPQAFLDIELKVAGLEKIVADALRLRPPQRFVVSSFLPEVVQQLHDTDSAIELGLICETQTELRHWKELPVQYVIPQYKLATTELIDQMKDAGKKILVWTVNSPKLIQRFAADGVDGIISDDVNLLCRTLQAVSGEHQTIRGLPDRGSHRSH
jgi:glycerophosphoryl diester phosphodiesterase